MKKEYKALFVIYILVLLGLLMITLCSNHAVTVIAQNAAMNSRHVIIIDPGHGGVDGGATSCTGVLESQLNLEIALRLRDLSHLLGYRTLMIRTEDISIYTKGESIAQKKISDLKERVRIINSSEMGIVLSIHQNHFSDSRYYGAQVFHTGTQESIFLAKLIQANCAATVNPGSKRPAKRAKGVYLMDHILRPGVLIECGFLSNPDEEAKLRDETYQKQLCCVIMASVSQYFTA